MLQKILERVKVPVCLIGIIGLIMAIINLMKQDNELASNGFLLFGIAAVVFVLSEVTSKTADNRRNLKAPERPSGIPEFDAPAPALATETMVEPLTVLGMIILLERPLRFASDQETLVRSIINQQKNEYKRVFAPSAQVQIRVVGASIDDDAYIYGACRNTFDHLGSCSDTDVFLQHVAVGSFNASDGTRGRHFALLNRKL
jgi:hypothetical protein